MLNFVVAGDAVALRIDKYRKTQGRKSHRGAPEKQPGRSRDTTPKPALAQKCTRKQDIAGPVQVD
jgi:hypothetical protein